MEVIVIGSGGVWSKGPTLEAAFDNAKKLGGFGKQVVIAVAPVPKGRRPPLGGQTVARRSFVLPSTPFSLAER